MNVVGRLKREWNKKRWLWTAFSWSQENDMFPIGWALPLIPILILFCR